MSGLRSASQQKVITYLLKRTHPGAVWDKKFSGEKRNELCRLTDDEGYSNRKGTVDLCFGVSGNSQGGPKWLSKWVSWLNQGGIAMRCLRERAVAEDA